MSERKDTLPASVEFFPGGANVTFGLSGTSIEVLEDYNQITFF